MLEECHRIRGDTRQRVCRHRRIRYRQWWDRKLLFSRDTERLATGHEQRKPRAGREEYSQRGSGLDHLFGVVEEEQEFSLAQKRPQTGLRRLTAEGNQAQRLGDGREDELRLADGGERNKANTVGEAVRYVSGDLEGEAGLADAAGAGQRDEPDIVLFQKTVDGRHLRLTSDQRRERNGERGYLVSGLGGDHDQRAPTVVIM
jgi:hypothetical protein